MGPLARSVALTFALSLPFLQHVTAWAAFPEDTAPTHANGSVNPERTPDPAVVASAQRSLESFFDHTNRTYAVAGFANAWLMREEAGNRQSRWLDQTMPLACGRLVTGWKARNWIPNSGWRHEPAPASMDAGIAVACEFTPPTAGAGGADPDTTVDPPAVRAAQRALTEFYALTNRGYSQAGHSSAWVMREELGNRQSAWLDMTMPLARGQLVGGWRGMNWIPGKGWQHSASPIVLAPTVSAPVVAWTPDRKSAAPLAADLDRAPRKPASRLVDDEVERIIEGSGLPLYGTDE